MECGVPGKLENKKTGGYALFQAPLPTIDPVPDTLHPTPFTLHPTPHNLNPTPVVTLLYTRTHPWVRVGFTCQTTCNPFYALIPEPKPKSHPDMGTSLIRKTPLLGPYSRPIPRVL